MLVLFESFLCVKFSWNPYLDIVRIYLVCEYISEKFVGGEYL